VASPGFLGGLLLAVACFGWLMGFWFVCVVVLLFLLVVAGGVLI
jgi:hypothetical protein